MRSTEKRYLTGEFAKHFGINKDTLLYYDKIGLFHPAGVAENGYRYYTVAQGETFWVLHSLRQMDVPIKELKDYFAAPSPAALEQLARTQLAAIDAEITQLLRTQWLLQQVESATREARAARVGEVLLCSLSAQRLFYSAPNLAEDDTSSDDWTRQHDAFLAMMGLRGSAYIGSVIAQDDLEAGHFARVHQLFVHDEARLFGDATLRHTLPPTAAVQHKKPRAGVRPAGQYAQLYVRGSYERVQEQYPFLLTEIARVGMRVCGNSYEEYLIHELASASEADYVTKVSVAVQAV